MKKKIISSQRLQGNPMLNKNLKNESRAEKEKKIQILTEKLANHFKKKLSNLIFEKNYKFSNLISDITSFVRKLENSNYEIETVLPRLEKHLLNILNKLPFDGHKDNLDIAKINGLCKTETNNTNGDYYAEEYIKSLPNTSIANNNNHSKIRVINSPIKNNKNVNSNYNKNINSNGRSGKNILKENSVFASKSGNAKLNSVSKTNSRKTLTNILSSYDNNNTKKSIKNYANFNKERKLKLSSRNINTENNGEYTNFNTIPGISKSVAKVGNLNSITNLITNKDEKNFIKKTEKLNDLKERALDEWAMIAKYNHLKHLEEEEKRKNFEEEKKKKIREILDNQMKEKDLIRKLKEEEDMKFFNLQAEKISDLEKDYIEKEKIKIEKVKMQREMQEKLIKGKFYII